MSDERVNGAIDAVARQMTALEPPDLRRKVMAQIAGEDVRRSTAGVRRSPFVVRGWVIVPLAAAVALAVYVAREPAPHAPSRREPETAADRAKPAAPVVAQESAKAAPALRATARLADARGPGPRAKAERETPDSPIDPITVSPLAVDTLAPESIQIPRLDAIAPMTVAPLDITDPQKERDE